MFVLSRNNKKIINKLIWITGTGRTGTTIGGKLISSFKNVEYFFEPNTIPSISSKANLNLTLSPIPKFKLTILSQQKPYIKIL